jgi:tetratricopeptide (TPR) repeat protein
VTPSTGGLFCLLAMTFITACGQQSPVAVSKAPAVLSNSPTSVQLRAGQYQELDRRYSAAQAQFENNELSGDDLRAQFRDFYATDPDLGSKLDGWVSQYPNSYVARAARGIYYKKVGFEARGSAYIRDTSQSQIDAMNTAFEKAVADLRASLNMSPKPFLSYFHLLDIGNAIGAKEEVRAIYDRANSLDPSSYAIRLKYMITLQSRWGGSLEEMQTFYNECQRAGLTDAQNKELQGMLAEEKVWLAQR